ncbi:MAG: DNA repair protein RadC [Victivallales bacterium]|nr:DNA repair protein RadC [Victivallales bacterium]
MQACESLPRERLMQFGAEALSDAELLAVLLRTGTKGTPVVEMAKHLLERFDGNVLRLCDATVNELCEIPGMGLAKSLELEAAFALSKRLARRRMALRPEMKSPQSIADYMQRLMLDANQECFYVLLLDTKLCLMRSEQVTIGLVDRSLVHAREVFRNAIREACSSIIICHNHPSGDVVPSANDIRITKMLFDAGEIIGIRLLDHLIIGPQKSNQSNNYFSFRENQLMPTSPIKN